MELSRLRVGNEDFLVASMIERCPKSMMLRELVKNALEAAANASDGGHRVEIGPLQVEGARKLAIWNTGPGMDADELFRMCDIASSIGKANALDQNFGMGAKVASLPSNTHGIRYRSCKAGRVHQVVMGKRNDIYGRLHQQAADGQMVDVLDVTTVAAEARDLAFDWTEVVLLGNRADQDTVANPYDGSPAMAEGWIAAELYGRFFSLGGGGAGGPGPRETAHGREHPHPGPLHGGEGDRVQVVLKEGCTQVGGDQVFLPIGERAGAFERYECVGAERGIRLHYYYDAADPERPGQLMSARGALQPAVSSAALIYRGEFYDVRPAWAWQHEAPVFGLPFGARYFSVHVELPDDFPLMPDGYRQFLRHAHNLQHHINVREFAGLALRHRPGWLLELLKNFAPDARHTAPLHDEMAAMFKGLKIVRRWWPPGGDGKPRPPGDGEPEYEVAPQIVPLRDEQDINERGMAGKAARFYGETHQLFVNTGYAAFKGFAGQLEQEWATHEDQERVRRAAVTITETCLLRQICRKLVFGLGKRGVWHGWEVDQACSMYSLTLAADDSAGLYAEARSAMARELGESAPDPKLNQARVRFAAALEEMFTMVPRQGGAPLEFSLRLGGG